MAEKFLEDFPITNSVMDFFAPKNWGRAQKNKDVWGKMESVSLGQLDAVYGEEGLAKVVVKANLAGIYSMGMNREMMNQQTADVTADLFVARYGYECTPYQMLIYFGGYLTDYKGTYQNYDVQDILMQFSKKFVPWMVQKKGVKEVKEVQKKVAEGPTGTEGLKAYLRIKLAKGENLRDGGLWRFGFINEAIVEEIENEAMAVKYSGGF